jgi:hypothetical protein
LDKQVKKQMEIEFMKKSIQLVFLVFVILAVLLGGCAPASTPIPPTFTPEPTSIPFVMPKGDFEMSWDIYSSEYNSLGGILTIRRSGSKYTQTLLMSDGSGETVPLSVKNVNGEERLHDDRFDDYYGDYMVIDKDGWLIFYDKQGYIYGVPPLK